MTLRPCANVEIERRDEPSHLQENPSVEATTRAVMAVEGDHDVTLTITPIGSDEYLLVGVDGSDALLALFRPDGIFQFVRDADAQGVRSLSIGSQSYWTKTCAERK